MNRGNGSQNRKHGKRVETVMMTLEEIKNVSFRKANIGGYRVEDVDDFIDRVEETVNSIAQENRAEKQKVRDLDVKLAECKSKEDSISQVLLNAQRQADSVVREAEQRAEIILQDARNEAQEIVSRAQNEIDGQKEAIETLKREVSQFKARLLGVYREHLTLIDALPGGEEEKAPEEPRVPAQEAKAQQAAPQQKKEAEARPQAEPEADSDAVDLDQLADEILAETETVPQEQKQTAPEQTAERNRQPRKTVSLFDSDYEFDDVPKTSRFESLKFGDDYDLKDDPEMASGGRKKR